MEDTCIACTERLATITFKACHHRLYCSECFPRLHPKVCPFRCPGRETEDSTVIQLRPTTVSDAVSTYNAGELLTYPFGYTSPHLPLEETLPTDYLAMRAKVQAVQAGRLDIAEIHSALGDLTVKQYHLVFVELYKDQDLHQVLKAIDRCKFETIDITQRVKEMVVTTFTSPSYGAIAARSGLAAVVDVLAEQTISRVTRLGGALSRPVLTAIPNVAMFVIFSGVEIYRWKVAKSVTGRECMKNLGEHFVGSVFGALGSYGAAVPCAAVGAAIGSVIPVIGTALGGTIGAIIGAFLGGIAMDATARMLYRDFIPRQKHEERETDRLGQRQMTAEEIAQRAAEKCNTNLQLDNFAEAQTRFRRKLLDNHPDKHPGATAEERAQLTAETQDLLACWQIVRQYYAERDANELSGEGYIRLYALKVFEAATQQWKTVRTFFADISVGRDLDPDTERIEDTFIYI